jgi:hypothetical protein
MILGLMRAPTQVLGRDVRVPTVDQRYHSRFGGVISAHALPAMHTSTQAKRHSAVRLRTCVTCASPIGMAGACMSLCDHSLSYVFAPGGSQNTHLLSRTRRGEPLGRPPPPSHSSAALYVAHPATRVALPEVPSARVLMRTSHA